MNVTEPQEGPAEIVEGDVKWYNPELGYGFIIDSKTGKDVLLGIGAMRRFGWWTVAKGSRLKGKVSKTDRGIQISEITEIVAPDELDDRNVFDFESLDYLADEFVPARITWYDEKLGYGFATTFGDGESCFVHWTALEQAGLLTLFAGDSVSVRIGRGKNGRVAASLRQRTVPSDYSGQRGECSALAAA